MTVTEQFKNSLVQASQTEVDTEFSHGAVGTGSTSESDTDTALDNEVLRKGRANFTESGVSAGVGDVTTSLFINSTEANGNTITEFGFFDASSGGEMQSRDVIPGVDKNYGIELFFELKIDFEVTESA